MREFGSECRLNVASLPRYKSLAVFARTLTQSLRGLGMHWIVNAGKKLGAHKWFLAGGDIPILSEEERIFASSVLEDEISIYEKLRLQASNGVVKL